VALIAIAGDKGAPGVTTTALALAAVWPRRSLFVEADPSGGDIVLRLRGQGGVALNPERGLMTLAIAARREIPLQELWQHVQVLDGGMEVLVGLGTAEQSAAMRGYWAPLGNVLSHLPDVDAIVDCGRVYPGSPALDIMRQAACVVLVARATVDGVAHLRARALSLSGELRSRDVDGVPLTAAVVTPPKYEHAAREVQAVLDAAGAPVRVIGRVAEDADGAAQLRGEWGRRLEKSLLIRTVRQVATVLASGLAQPAPSGPQGGGPAGPAVPGGPGSPGGPSGASGATGPQAQQRPPGPQAPPAPPGAPVPPGPPGRREAAPHRTGRG
jgi:hypothetical protein